MMMTEEEIIKSNFWSQNIYKVILLTLLLGMLILLAVFGIKRLLPGSTDIKASVWPRTLSIKDSIYFKDSTGFAKSARWAFGDGNQSFVQNGAYHYNKPGNYLVQLTVNNRYTDTFFVTVYDTAKVVSIRDSVATIDAPVMGMQLENLVFRATAVGATQYRWQFGESGGIDSKEAFAQYYYKKAGDYTVLLYTDNSQYPTRHNIKILPSYQRMDTTTSIDTIIHRYENDFRWHLQQIANGNSFNSHYYYLLKKYLCNNEKATIKINGQKVNDFNSYCLGLQFDKAVTIESVKLTPDESFNCMRAVEVKQVKGQ